MKREELAAEIEKLTEKLERLRQMSSDEGQTALVRRVKAALPCNVRRIENDPANDEILLGPPPIFCELVDDFVIDGRFLIVRMNEELHAMHPDLIVKRDGKELLLINGIMPEEVAEEYGFPAELLSDAFAGGLMLVEEK